MRIEVAVARLVALKAAVEQLNEERERVIAELQAAVDAGDLSIGTHDTPHGALVVTRPRRTFDAKRFEADYPYESHPDLFDAKPNASRAREVVGDRYDKVGETTFRVL